MLQNLHTHTVFCDGRNTPQEMADRALELRFDSLGFSAHAKTSVGTASELRDVDGYIKEINSLKEKYRGRLKIYLGAELDYFSAGVMPTESLDYAIASVHFAYLDGRLIMFDNNYERAKRHIAEDFGGDGLKFAKLYYETLSDMPNKIHGDFVGHFDLVTKFTERDTSLLDTASKKYRDVALTALHAVREHYAMFEVNTGAIGRGYRTSPYPAPFILDEMKALKCKLILTSDCHNKDFLDCHFKEAKEYIKSHGFDELWYLTDTGFAAEKI